MEEDVEKEETKYDVEITFDEESYEWVVSYMPKILSKTKNEPEGRIVRIRKDNGMITVSENSKFL